jgi:hypothetical protein
VPVTDSMPDLSWLADSPVFIDGQQVGAFYDAVVGPAFRTIELQVTASWAEQLEKSAAGHLNAGLSALFPWLKADAGLEAGKAVNQPERICVVNQNTPFPGAEAIAASPRMIAFVDVPQGTRFLPQAAELNDGRVVTFFSPLIEKLKRDGGTLPVAYPETTTTDVGRRQRDAYWHWFTDHWNADKAVQVVEDVIGAGGRPRWIAYRVIFGTGETLHLDVTPAATTTPAHSLTTSSDAANGTGCGS